jgi:type I restriction enzyme S subunit
MTGAVGHKRVAMEFIEPYPIPVPPLTEQQRIVAILDEAFEGIATAKANTEKNLQNARALFENHLHDVFTQAGSSRTRRKLGNVCERITVGHVGSMAAKYQPSGVPFLRSQNVRPFQISLDNVVYIDEAFDAALRKSRLRPGDVAVVRTGYPGTAAVIPESLPSANCSDLVIVRPGPSTDPHYLALFFNSRLGKELVAGEVVGAAQKHFNISAAKEVEIAFPSRDEQGAIVARMNLFRQNTLALEVIHERKLAALDALKSSLLHQAFTGNL